MANVINRLVWGIAVLAWIGLLGLALLVTFRTGKPSLGTSGNLQTRGTYGTVPEFSLVNQDGKQTSSKQLKGNIWIVDFIFTRCEMQCKMMTQKMRTLTEELPDPVKFVSVSVDPKHDRPTVLRKYRKEMKATDPSWNFLTGEEQNIKNIIKQKFHLPLSKNPDDSKNILTHSNRFVLVDSRGRIRGYYRPNIKGELETLKKNVMFLLWESKAHDRPRKRISGLIPLSWFPEVNSSLNFVAGMLLFLGFYFIKIDRKKAHITSMICALASTGLFLACYLTYHSYHGTTPFPGTGSIKTLYFFILISHTVLAALLPILVPVLLYFAISKKFESHRKLGKWTLPIWLYVSATGVMVYLLLYRYFWAPPY